MLLRKMEPIMTETIKWGILGTGNIAHSLATALQPLDDAEIFAVGSRSQDKATAFGQDYGIAPDRCYGSYEALVADSDVDIVYVSTPHPFHHDNAMLALDHRKAVLVEKPFTLNATEARALVEKANQQGVFLMEAMWTRFFPIVAQVRSWLAEGMIGEIRYFAADFAVYFDFDATHRLFAPDLGGGALLDLGVYPISFASMVMGNQPQEIVSRVNMAQTGVDDTASMVFRYSDGTMANLFTSSRFEGPTEAIIIGSLGTIRVHSKFLHPDRVTLEVRDGTHQTVHIPLEWHGLSYQAMEVMGQMQAGNTQSPLMPWQESVAIMETLDRIRADWGLVYPSEQ
jgi:dihydrodiol dehydrogenase / D-xylose 1-dehydrogenase (NADP)